jgi:hypothetical protein
MQRRLTLLASSCVAGGAVRGRSPRIEAVIAAARADDASALADLCDPEGHADADARRVCAADPANARDWTLFRAWFAEARILGLVATTAGPDEMHVAVAIGPDHRRVEVTVVRRGERWYLLRL